MCVALNVQATTHTLTSTTLKNFIWRVGSRPRRRRRRAGTILNKVTTRLVTSRATLH